MRESNQRLYDGEAACILASYSGSLELKTQAWPLRIFVLSRCSSTIKKNYGIILQYGTWTRNFTIHLSKLKSTEKASWTELAQNNVHCWACVMKGAFGFFKSGKFPDQLNTYPPSHKYSLLG